MGIQYCTYNIVSSVNEQSKWMHIIFVKINFPSPPKIYCLCPKRILYSDARFYLCIPNLLFVALAIWIHAMNIFSQINFKQLKEIIVCPWQCICSVWVQSCVVQESSLFEGAKPKRQQTTYRLKKKKMPLTFEFRNAARSVNRKCQTCNSCS